MCMVESVRQWPLRQAHLEILIVLSFLPPLFQRQLREILDLATEEQLQSPGAYLIVILVLVVRAAAKTSSLMRYVLSAHVERAYDEFAYGASKSSRRRSTNKAAPP